MKKLITSIFTVIFFLGNSLHAEILEGELSANISSIAGKISQFVSSPDQTDENLESNKKNCFSCSECSIKSSSTKSQSVSTSVFTYQYTNDGWLQQLAHYSSFIVGTNLAGPREGLQIIMWENLSMDMCHSYKEHKDYISHKYSWGEIRTYKTSQTVIWN